MFYMVFHPREGLNRNNTPTFKHDTYAAAEREAERLTSYDGRPSFVLQSLTRIEKAASPFIKTNLLTEKAK